MRKSMAVAMLFVFMLVMASASYAQTMGQLVDERENLTDDLQSYRVQAAKNIKGAEVRLIELDAIIADRQKTIREAAAVEKALKEAEVKAALEAEAVEIAEEMAKNEEKIVEEGIE